MQKSNSQILDHFYSLLMEMNFHWPEEDVFDDAEFGEDAFVQKHLRQMKLKMAKLKAQQNKGGFYAILEEIKRLRSLNVEELSKLLNPAEQMQLQPLFRRFEELTKADEESIANDAELLHLISSLRKKLNETEKKSDNE